MSFNRHLRLGWVGSIALLISIALVWSSAPSSAHSDLESSTPARGSTVVGPIEEIELVFAQPIVFAQSSFEVVDDDHVYTISSAEIASDDRTVTLALDPPVMDGDVVARYAVISADSHPRTGSFAFAVEAPPIPSTSAPSTTLTAPTERPTPDASAAKSAADRATAPLRETPAPSAAPSEPTPNPSSTAAPRSRPENAASEDELSAGLAVGSAFEPRVEPQASSGPTSSALGDPDRIERLIDAQTVLRGVGYAGAVLLIGGLLYFVWVEPFPANGTRRVILLGAAAATLISGVGLVATQSAIVSGGETGALRPSNWGSVFEGRFALGIALRVVAAIGSIWALKSRAVTAVVAAVGALSFPLTGHGLSRDPVWIVFPADLVHVFAVAVWSGGLLMLVFGLATERRRSLSAAITPQFDAVRRFSAAAGAALGAAFVTGIALAATELERFGDLVDTSYGRRLVMKLVLVTALVGLGSYNRYRLIPLIRVDGADSPATRRLVVAGGVEIAVMAVVLIVTTLLVNAAG